MNPNTGETRVVPAAVDRLLPGWARALERPDFDMDDGPDLPAFKEHNRLGAALDFLQVEVWPAFDRADKAALHHQRVHRRLTEVAAVSGALAVLFGVVQLVFPALVHWWWVSGIEVGVAIVALLVVLFGVRAAIQFNWLLERHRAERLRQLKFAVLIHEDLWCGRFEAWQGHVRHEVQALQHIERKGMEDWADRDRIPLPEKNTAGCALGAGPLQALAGYYIAKRLGYQMSYFARRSQKHGGQDRWLRHWPAWCFYGSVAAVALHYLLDVAPCCAAGVGWLSQAFMLLALALPVVGACIRTVRVARELGRSAALFRAKHAALQDLLQRMLTELAAVPVHSEAVVHSVAACEDFLKAEQREWLRLMREAEWFG